MLYTGFVDDILVAVSGGVDICWFLNLLSLWDRNIVVTHEASEASRRTSFLDLMITVSELSSGLDKLSFETFAKPLNLYMYTPFASCHPRSTFLAIAIGEFKRAGRTCSDATSLHKQCELLRRKFCARGYPSDFVDLCFQRAFAEQLPMEPVDSSVCFSTRFFEGAESLRLANAVGKHLHLLDLGGVVRPIACFRSNKNLFRLRYARFINTLRM